MVTLWFNCFWWVNHVTLWFNYVFGGKTMVTTFCGFNYVFGGKTMVKFGS